MLIQVRLVPLMVIWYTCHVFGQPGLLQSKRTQCFHRDQRVTGWCFGSFWTISWSTDLAIFVIKASKKWFAKFFQITITQTCMAYDNTSCGQVRLLDPFTSSYLVVSGAQSCFRTWWGRCTHICCSSTCSTSWKGGCTSVDINISRRHRYVYIIWYTDV